MQFLMIQNQFESPTEGFTTLGLSTSTEKTIGQFGSGSNHGILCCLRAGLKVIVYCGRTRLTFGTREATIIEDGIGEKVVKYVTVRKGNNQPRDLDWVLKFGSKDWDGVGMALREFVSNAIDRQDKAAEGWARGMDDGLLSVKMVDQKDARAKSGFTRVYVEVNDEVREYFSHLGENFLHFSQDRSAVERGLLRNPEGPADIYRCGVRVCTVDEREGEALFNYNFTSTELKIDECRNSNTYIVQAACAEKLRTAERHDVAVYLASLSKGEDTFESRLNPDQMLRSWESPTEEETVEWKAAAYDTFGEAKVVTNGWTEGRVQEKGHETVRIEKADLVRIMHRLGVPTGSSVLNEREMAGTEVSPPTQEVEKAFNWAWELLTALNIVEGEKPGILCYEEKLDDDASKLSYVSKQFVYLRRDITNDQARKQSVLRIIDILEQNSSARQDLILEVILRQEKANV